MAKLRLVGGDDLEEKIEKGKKNLDDAMKAELEPYKFISQEAWAASAEYLQEYDGKEKVEKKDIPDELDKRAETYIKGLGMQADGKVSDYYGNMLRSWFRQMGRDGMNMLKQVEDAIEQGDEMTAVYFMQKAYENNVATGKRELAKDKYRKSSEEVRLGISEEMAKDINAEKPSLATVIEDWDNAYDLLTKRKREAQNYENPDYQKAA